MKFFICPHCQQQYEYDPDFVDKKINCLKCEKQFICINTDKPKDPEYSKTIIITNQSKITKHVIIHLPEFQQYEKSITSEQHTQILKLSPKIDLQTINKLDKIQARQVIEQLEYAHRQYHENRIEGIFLNNFDLLEDDISIDKPPETKTTTINDKDTTETETAPINNEDTTEKNIYNEKITNGSLIRFKEHIKEIKEEIQQVDKLSELIISIPSKLLEGNLLKDELKDKLENAVNDFENNGWMDVCSVYRQAISNLTDRMDIIYNKYCDDDSWIIKFEHIKKPTIKQFYDICFYLEQVYGQNWDKVTANTEPCRLIKTGIKIIFPELIYTQRDHK